MKNQEVVKAFVNGETEKKGSHLFIEGNVLYSYGYHFPLIVRLFGGYLINIDSYSRTTSKHQGMIIRELTPFSCLSDLKRAKENTNLNGILFFNTEKLKEIIALNPETLEDVKTKLILSAI
jgi:hypothetical protein